MIHVNSFLWIEWSLKHREKIETGEKGLLTPTVLLIPEKSPVFYAFGSNWTRCVCGVCLFFSFLFAIFPLEVSTVWLPRSAKLKTWFLYLEEKYSGVLVMGNKRAFNALWAFIRNLFVEHIWFICYYFYF